MANYYVRSSDGDNGNAGTPGAPFLNLKGFEAAHSAGDRCYVSDLHSHNYNAATTMTFADDAPATPCEIICIDDWGAETDPGSITHAASTGASETSGGTNNFDVRGCFYMYGMTLEASPTASTVRQLYIGNQYNKNVLIVLERCLLKIHSGQIDIGSDAGGFAHLLRFRDCQVRFGNAAAYIDLKSRLVWENTLSQQAVLGTAPSTFIISSAQYRRQPSGVFVGLDLSNISGTIFSDGTYVNYTLGVVAPVVFRRCKLHSSVTLASLGSVSSEVAFVECDSGTNFIRQAKHDYNGTVTEDTVRVRDNSNSLYSHKLVSAANTKFYSPLRSFPVKRYNATEGSAITVRVEILTDNVTLTDGEFWIEANYLGSASYPLGSIASSAKADILATAANLSTSSEGWTTTGITTPVKQYAEVTFTPNESGPIEITACLAKASTTVYVDPYPTVS